MTDQWGAAVGFAAFAAMFWLNRRPTSWWEPRPRGPRPDPWRSMHKTPTQVTIIRRGTGSELERRPDR